MELLRLCWRGAPGPTPPRHALTTFRHTVVRSPPQCPPHRSPPPRCPPHAAGMPDFMELTAPLTHASPTPRPTAAPARASRRGAPRHAPGQRQSWGRRAIHGWDAFESPTGATGACFVYASSSIAPRDISRGGAAPSPKPARKARTDTTRQTAAGHDQHHHRSRCARARTRRRAPLGHGERTPPGPTIQRAFARRRNHRPRHPAGRPRPRTRRTSTRARPGAQPC